MILFFTPIFTEDGIKALVWAMVKREAVIVGLAEEGKILTVEGWS